MDIRKKSDHSVRHEDALKLFSEGGIFLGWLNKHNEFLDSKYWEEVPEEPALVDLAYCRKNEHGDIVTNYGATVTVVSPSPRNETRLRIDPGWVKVSELKKYLDDVVSQFARDLLLYKVYSIQRSMLLLERRRKG